MDNDGYAGGKKIVLLHIQRLLHGMGQMAMNSRKIYTTLFKNIAVLNDACAAASSAIPFPQFFFKKCPAIGLFKCCANFVLYKLVIRRYLFLRDHRGKDS